MEKYKHITTSTGVILHFYLRCSSLIKMRRKVQWGVKFFSSMQIIFFMQGALPNWTMNFNLTAFCWYTFTIIESGKNCLNFSLFPLAPLKEMLEWIMSKHRIIFAWTSTWKFWVSKLISQISTDKYIHLVICNKFDCFLEDLTLSICFKLSFHVPEILLHLQK